MNASERNASKNKSHYDEMYGKVDVKRILDKIENVKKFMDDVTQTDTSWTSLYGGNFQNQLRGKKVLELGCGDCTNAAVMAAYGAEVHANDISQKSGEIIRELNANYAFEHQIKFIEGDLLKSEIDNNYYDIVVGKSFIHHLTHQQEIEFTKKIVATLKPNGLVRYFEPAVNNKFLDELRWLTPVHKRPSKLQKKKFKQWKLNDPHPERDNSSKRYEEIGRKYFKETTIVPIGSIERFHKFLPKKIDRKFRRFAFRLERKLPKSINLSLTRSHMIEYKYPKKSLLN